MSILTDAGIKGAIAEATSCKVKREIRDEASRGLSLLITPNGIATFYVVYRAPGDGSGAPRRHRLGRYPSELSLKRARDEAAGVRDRLRVGIDPQQERREAKAAADKREEEARRLKEVEAGRLTVKMLVVAFLAAKKGIDWHDKYQRMLERNVIPTLGKRAAEDVTPRDITAIVDTIIARGSPGEAVKVFEVIRAMFKWAVKRQRLAASPVNAVEPPAKAGARERVLTNDEVRALWLSLDRRKLPAQFPRIVKLALLLGQRSGEISKMTWAELSPDLRHWTLPGRRTKNENEHKVPVPKMAREIIAEAIADAGASRFVFPARRNEGEPDKPTTPETVASVMYDLARYLCATDPASGRPWEAPADPSTTAPFTDSETGQASPIRMHDLRRTMATRMAELPVPVSHHVVEAVLNHVSSKNATVGGKHYIFAELGPVMAEALIRWQQAVEDILAGGDPFRGSRGEDMDAMEARLLRPAGGNVVQLRVAS